MSSPHKRNDEKRPSISEVLEEVDSLVTSEAQSALLSRKQRRSVGSNNTSSHRDRAAVVPDEGTASTEKARHLMITLYHLKNMITSGSGSRCRY